MMSERERLKYLAFKNDYVFRAAVDVNRYRMSTNQYYPLEVLGEGSLWNVDEHIWVYGNLVTINEYRERSMIALPTERMWFVPVLKDTVQLVKGGSQ